MKINFEYIKNNEDQMIRVFWKEDNKEVQKIINLLTPSPSEIKELNNFIIEEISSYKKIEFEKLDNEKNTIVENKILSAIVDIYKKEYNEILQILEDNT